MDNETLLEYVRSELDSRKGSWPAIARVMEPDPKLCGGYYSWLTKFARGKINRLHCAGLPTGMYR
jgi:hypothetical protein